MCGIAGEVGFPRNLDWVTRQIAFMRFRGPDHQSVKCINPQVTMGVARLAMTDPHPRSAQPMIDKFTGDAISFNGEIYNFREIRQQLMSNGVKFETDSDTEVLLKFLSNGGIYNLSKLNGMYAFAFFSSCENRLYFSRDELGKKPLYILKKDSIVRWSSCIRSFYESGEKLLIADEALVQYLSLGYILDPETVKSEIKSINPGSILSLDLNTMELREVSEKIAITDREHLLRTTNTLRFAIKSSVEERIAGHDRIALSLSGGVDSAVIAIELASLNLETTAFSAIWTDSDKLRYNQDAIIAEKIAAKLGLKFQFVEMLRSSQVSEVLKKFLVAMEEPNNNPSGLSMLNLYSQISNSGHRLAMTGDGSDELLGGYARYSKSVKIPQILKLRNEKFVETSFVQSSSKKNFLRNLLASQLSPSSPFSWLRWHWVFNPNELSQIMNNSKTDVKSSTLMHDFISRIEIDLSKKNPLALMIRDHKIWLAMESNRKLDRISMFNSVEARSPFQDKRVIAWAHRELSSNTKSQLNKSNLWVAYPELMHLNVRKDKAGFTSPVGHWLRNNPELVRSSLSFLAHDKRFRNDRLKAFSDAPNRGNYRELMQLWTLVVLATWLQMSL